MALWQFPFFIVPNSWVNQQVGTLEKYLGDDGWNLGDTWMFENKPISYLSELDRIFPEAESWSADLTVWKSQAHDSDIYAWYEAGSLYELQMRLDLRANVQDTVQDIVQFSSKHGLSFFIMRSGKICPADTDLLITHVLSSRQEKLTIPKVSK